MTYTAARSGQANGSGDALALFLKVYAGEVLTAFATNNVMMERSMVRTIQSGKSASFPVTGKLTASYVTPGNRVTEQIARHNERIINIDSLLDSSVWVADLDEAMNHYDVRSIYSTEQGEALAAAADRNVLQATILAARASSVITGISGGGQVVQQVGQAFRTNSADLIRAIFAAAQILDEKDVPETERYTAVRPAQYYLLAQNTTLLNKDWGGMGTYADAKVLRIAGTELVKTNNLPQTDIASAVTGTNNTYHGNFTNTAFVTWQKKAVGTVKLMDLRVQQDYSQERKATLISTDYAMGHGILRPECAVEGAVA